MALKPLIRSRPLRAFALGFVTGAATMASPALGLTAAVCLGALLLPIERG